MPRGLAFQTAFTHVSAKIQDSESDQWIELLQLLRHIRTDNNYLFFMGLAKRKGAVENLTKILEAIRGSEELFWFIEEASRVYGTGFQPNLIKILDDFKSENN